MRKLLVVSIILLPFVIGCQTKQATTSNNPDEEVWVNLFNGKDLDDWTIKISGQDTGKNYNNTFRVNDGMIQVKYDEYDSFKNDFGHLYYKEPFSYYKLKLDYRINGEQLTGGPGWAGYNSGVMLHAQSAESNEVDQQFPVSVEMQFLASDGKDRNPTTCNVCTPGTAIDQNGETNYKHCINSSSKVYNNNEWRSVEAIVKGAEEMIFVVEQDTVFTLQNPQIGGGLIHKGQTQEDWAKMGFPNFGENWIPKDNQPLSEGYIALQAESHPVDFKNVRLLNLCGCMDKKAKNYKSYYLKDDPKSCVY